MENFDVSLMICLANVIEVPQTLIFSLSVAEKIRLNADIVFRSVVFGYTEFEVCIICLYSRNFKANCLPLPANWLDILNSPRVLKKS